MTWNRDSPLVEQGLGDPAAGRPSTVQTLKAREAAVGVAQANVAAQQAQLQVLNQQKAYQRVVAPFDGVITQRNIDVGSLVQADAASGTFMFTIMQSNVIRTQVYRAAGPGVRIGARGRCRRARSRNPGSHVSRQGDADRRCAAARHANAADRRSTFRIPTAR